MTNNQHKNIYTWQEIAKIFVPKNYPSDFTNEIGSLITTWKKFGIGNPISFQKNEYTTTDLEKIKLSIELYKILYDKTLKEFRDKKTNKITQESICTSIINNSPILIYSVFCPSYKKGRNEIGYTGITGTYTKATIIKLINFVTGLNSIWPTKCIAYFSDLLLENYELLKNTDYKHCLMKNYDDFKKIISELDSGNTTETKLLSDVSDFAEHIGEKGLTIGKININPKTYEILINRNKIFYEQNLGWTIEQIQNRTDTLIRCYEFMGQKFKKIYPSGIMFWTESAYERGIMYNNLIENDPLAIIYPIKENHA